jgi:signal transduction histidine kinase/FixJ family two-component response regulator
MILIVDDKQENIFSLRTVLEQHGFSADPALSGEEALKKLLKKEYALIILDVQMPGMDGFEVAEAITGLNKTKDIPIIFLSAVNTHKRFITKGFESGAVDYLTKPVDPDILILKVRNFYRLFEKTHALKEAEKALTLTVDELHSTLEALPQLAFTADRDGRIDFVNRQWFEYSSSKDKFPETPEGHLPLELQWLRSIDKGEPVETEVPLKKLADGQFYYHLLKATPVKASGIVTKWVGSFTSIHEQKMLNETLERKVAERTRELLEANRDLEVSNHDLQQFTSVASHDLKEPLRKIQFFGNLLRERAGLEPGMEAYLNKIVQASVRMSNLITDLLSFASLSGPNLFQPADMGQIISEIMSDLELSIAEKEARIDVGPMPQVEAIPGLIRQLFQNIISNALKFSKPDQPPHIRVGAERTNTPSVDGPCAEDGAWCRISIADNGIGFDEKYADKIFTLFQRLNARAEYEGTGIGLAIAKKIVDRHNGTIAARSVQGEGSTFYVILPVKQDQLRREKEENQFIATTLP